MFSKRQRENVVARSERKQCSTVGKRVLEKMKSRIKEKRQAKA
jgi:hypothetical protein